MSRPDIYSKGNKNQRATSSLAEQLVRQLRFLTNSCAAFDAGYEDEAIRLATTVRVLLHQTNSSHALLSLLGIRESLTYLDTGVYEDRLWAEIQKAWPNAISVPVDDVGLVCLTQVTATEFGWVAPLDALRFDPNMPAGKSIPWTSDFETWWRKPLINTQDRPFSRQTLVLVMANQDGGAHVDPELDSDYQAFLENGLASRVVINSDGSLLEKPHEEWPRMKFTPAYASMRQIAHELIRTVERHLAASS